MTFQPAQPFRSPAEVRRSGNRLQHERSLYLKQHAANPVDWHPWDEQALALARATDRPIFLSSGYSSCHWCHVMEHEVFEHDDVAEVLNRRFVCIKVDREESPEVDATYMEAVQLMTGRGGWPMSVFLTPDLQPFFGATYIPKPRFLTLLAQIDDLWRTRRDEVVGQAGSVAARIVADLRQDGPPAAVDRERLAAAVSDAADRFDDRDGGFVGPMKFPVPVRWTFLLHWHRRTGDPDARRMVEHTLEAMSRGGLYDHVGGGFHRYTVDAGWTVPHFEKMLYDNAQLARLYLEAGVALDRDDFTAVGLDVLEFLDREMCGPEGAAYASLDADSDGEEGTYYVWTPAQLRDALGHDDGSALARDLGVTREGNFEHGASVITRRRHRAGTADDRRFDAHRERLREARASRVAPTLDRKIITGWNGLALSAFARGALATGRDDLASRAVSIARCLHDVHRMPDGRLARASNGGRAIGAAVLEDHALLAQGLLDLFQLTGDAAHLGWAQELVAIVQAEFVREGGAWYTTSAGVATPLGRRVELFDNVIPSGCSVMLDVLQTLAAITGERGPHREVEGHLAAHSSLISRAGLEMAGWLDAALRQQGPIAEVVVVGEATDPTRLALWRQAAASLSPAVVVVPVGPDGPSAQLLGLVPALAGKTAVDGRAVAHVCRSGTCAEPTSDTDRLRQELVGH